jgi:hypothetical protein
LFHGFIVYALNVNTVMMTRNPHFLLCSSIFIFLFLHSVCAFMLGCTLTLSNPIFLPPAYSPALIYFGQEKGWWITCNYPTVLKEKNRNRKSTTCAICWLKSVLHEEK